MHRHLALALLLPLTLAAASARAGSGWPSSDPEVTRCARLGFVVDLAEWLVETTVVGGELEVLIDELAASAARGAAEAVADTCVRLNHLQLLGTHNSYHLEAPADLLEILIAFSPELAGLEYAHRPLAEQLELLGVRQFELDVFADPDGGLYAQRRGLLIVGRDADAGLPELEAPGFKVLHAQDVDFETTCLTFVACLEVIQSWSEAHPGHLPITVLVEAKSETIPDPLSLGFTVPLAFDPELFRDLDAEIRSVFPERQLITPDDVRRGAPTLREGLFVHGWPTLGEARGRVLFALDNGGAERVAYVDGDPSLAGRVLFPNANPEDPDAAFVKRNDPQGSAAEIPVLVRQGFLVRTRADADTLQARLDDPTQRDAALRSGAQLVSSDYPEPDLRFSGYQVRIPGGGVARCNPVAAPRGCRDAALERLE